MLDESSSGIGKEVPKKIDRKTKMVREAIQLDTDYRKALAVLGMDEQRTPRQGQEKLDFQANGKGSNNPNTMNDECNGPTNRFDEERSMFQIQEARTP